MVTPTAANFEAGLRAWVAAGSGLDPKFVQPGNTVQPAPNVPYATVLLVQPAQPGRPSQRRTVNADGDIEVVTRARIIDRYSVQFFRDGARDNSRRFSVWAYSPEGQQWAKSGAHPFSLMRVVSLTQIDGIISEDYEPRDGVMIDVGYHQTVTQTLAAWTGADIEVHQDGLEVEIIEVGS